MKNPVKNKTVFVLLVALGFCGFYIFSCWFSVSENGSDLFYRGGMYVLGLLFLTTLMLVLGTLRCLLMLLLPKRRAEAWSGFKMLFKISGFLVVFIIVTLAIGDIIRNLGLRAMTVRARPLIVAIRNYQATNGVPSNALDDLVPKYIESIPATKVGAYPEFNFVRNQNPDRYGSNTWILDVPISADKQACEFLVYYPNHNYPASGKGNVMVSPYGHWVSIEFNDADAKLNGFPVANDAQ
jgi:hypothetical protein